MLPFITGMKISWETVVPQKRKRTNVTRRTDSQILRMAQIMFLIGRAWPGMSPEVLILALSICGPQQVQQLPRWDFMSMQWQ